IVAEPPSFVTRGCSPFTMAPSLVLRACYVLTPKFFLIRNDYMQFAATHQTWSRAMRRDCRVAAVKESATWRLGKRLGSIESLVRNFPV
ncbi:MAG TPA: hypothetical protein VIV60_02085, partial [Polyangiaceae bacterium]